MTQSFDRRSFMAGGLALGAGAAMLGGLEGEAGAAQTNGPGRNGISTAKPVKGGSLTFGIDTEESGFNPSTARWDEGGFLYGRTVMDPIAIVNAAGGVEPYLAQSITSNEDFTSFTITLRPGIVFHDGTPLDANALHLNIEKQADVRPDRAGLRRPDRFGLGDGAAGGHHRHEDVVGPVPLLPGPGPDRATSRRRPCSTAPDGGTSNPVGTGPFVFQDWVPNSHMTATQESPLLAQGSTPTSTPSPSSRSSAPTRAPRRSRRARSTSCTPTPPTASCSSGATRSRSYYDNSGQVVGQPTVQCIHVEHFDRPLQQQDAAHGHGHVHQPGPVLQGHRQGRRRADERPVPPGERVLHQDRLPELQPHSGGQTGQAGAATDGQAGRRSRSTPRATRTSCGPPSSCSRPGSRPA